MGTTPKKPRLNAHDTGARTRSSISTSTNTATHRSTLAALPPAIVSSIFSYVLRDVDLDVADCRWGVPPPFRDIAIVSKEWHALADEVASERALRKLTLCGDALASRSSMLQMRRKMTLRRGHLRRLITRVVPDFGSTSNQSIWAAALAHAPRLQELDLEGFSSIECLAQIVNAAAQQCPQVEKLLFPVSLLPHEWDTTPRSKRDDIRVLTSAVFGAMHKWRTLNGGLQHLHLPLAEFIKGHETAKEYIDTVIATSPHLQLLNGYTGSVNTSHFVQCKEQWMLDVETWDTFCRTFTQLTFADWVSLPFATRFFEVFAKYRKPKLERLSLTTASNWNWKKYLREVPVSTQTDVQASGYGSSARNIHRVLEACPNLRELTVHWFDQRAGSVANRPMNAELFGDDFCESLARHCPRLEVLDMSRVQSLFGSRVQSSIVTLTDRSMVALATLPYLDSVEISGANFTGDGLFELVVNHNAETRRERQYHLYVGDASHGTTATVFYTAVLGFLKRLAAHDGELRCAHRPVVLQLINSNKRRVDEGFSAEFFATALLLVDKIKAKFPTITLRGLVTGYDDEYCVFARMKEFGFATSSSKMGDWDDPDEYVKKERSIDGVFVDRKYVEDATSDYSDGDEEEEEEEEVEVVADDGEEEEDDDDDGGLDSEEDDDEHDDDDDIDSENEDGDY